WGGGEKMFCTQGRAGREVTGGERRKARRRARPGLLPSQGADLGGLSGARRAPRVTTRARAPPLHEFLPHDDKGQAEMAKEMGVSKEKIAERVKSLHEQNPMLGFRGCRLGIVYPEITEMQARAVFEAACIVAKEGIKVEPEVM